MQPILTFLLLVGVVAIIVLSPARHFFSDVALNWLSDANSNTSDQQIFASPDESPTVANIFDQVTSGWRFDTVVHFWGPWFTLSLFISLFLAVGITYCVVRLMQIRRIERIALHHSAHPVAAKDLPRTQLRWNHVHEEAASDDPQKWRLAILEADIMLNELLDVLGYKGETMEEKMKKVDIAAFNSIDFAWEAHKIRNRIVKEGPQFQLDERETRRIIKMYERVFKEFKFIA